MASLQAASAAGSRDRQHKKLTNKRHVMKRYIAQPEQRDGNISQATLNREHLLHRCGFCGRWIAEEGMIETHSLRIHTDIARHITAELHKACVAFKHLLKRDQSCPGCERVAPNVRFSFNWF